MAKKLPRKTKWPKGLKARLRKLDAKEEREKKIAKRLSDNKAEQKKIEAARKRLAKA